LLLILIFDEKEKRIMSNIDIVRAWKDEDYRDSLTPEQRAALPENPAGMVELSDSDLGDVDGAFTGLECSVVITFSIVSVVTAVTAIQSCSMACDKTMNVGTCGIGTSGCC
jgi:mersacidin/lichenicidin family type 2 lantibiotic